MSPLAGQRRNGDAWETEDDAGRATLYQFMRDGDGDGRVCE